MKKLNLIVCMTFVFTLFVLSGGFESRENRVKVAAAETQQESTEPSQAAKTNTDHKEEYKQKTEQKLAEFGDRLRTFKDRAERAGGKAKTELREAANRLDRKMVVAKQQFEKFKSASGRTWEKAKSQLDAAMRDLERTYDQVVARFKRSDSEQRG